MLIRLNLIPQSRKDEIMQDGRLRTVLKLGAELSIMLIVFATVLFGINYILQINLRSVSNQIEEDKRSDKKYQEMEKYESEMKNLNAKTADIEKISKNQIYWSKFFEKLNSQVVPEAEITNILTQDYSVLLAGRAQNRDKTLEFKENLAKEECFLDVNLPLSNLVTKENVDFQIDFNINPECLK